MPRGRPALVSRYFGIGSSVGQTKTASTSVRTIPFGRCPLDSQQVLAVAVAAPHVPASDPLGKFLRDRVAPRRKSLVCLACGAAAWRWRHTPRRDRIDCQTNNDLPRYRFEQSLLEVPSAGEAPSEGSSQQERNIPDSWRGGSVRSPDRRINKFRGGTAAPLRFFHRRRRG